MSAAVTILRDQMTWRRVRLACGLVLFTYVTLHFAMHASGLWSFAAMQSGTHIHDAVWHSKAGTWTLYGAFAIHFSLGLYALYARRSFRMGASEMLRLILGFVSGLVVLGMGVVLAIQRWPAAREAMGRSAHSFRRAAHAGYVMGRLQHAHSAAGWHSHGGTWHTHAPPADRVTWGGLLALGVSGGLVPCPSAMVLLLAAVALNKTAFGLALVVAFSTGLAMTLTAIGLLFLYARNRLPTGARAPRWTRIVPLASAAAIVLIGALLCHAALTGGPI